MLQVNQIFYPRGLPFNTVFSEGCIRVQAWLKLILCVSIFLNVIYCWFFLNS